MYILTPFLRTKKNNVAMSFNIKYASAPAETQEEKNLRVGKNIADGVFAIPMAVGGAFVGVIGAGKDMLIDRKDGNFGKEVGESVKNAVQIPGNAIEAIDRSLKKSKEPPPSSI